MQCNQIGSYFADYIKEGLQGPAQTEFSQHLKECPACNAKVEALTDIWVKVGSVPPGEPASPDMDVRFRAAVEEAKQELNSKQHVYPARRPPRSALVATAALLLVLASIAIVQRPVGGSAPPAVVEIVDGSLYRIWGGKTDPMHAGDSIRLGEIVRSNGGAGAVLALADGSRVEMRSKSELSLESADDGVRIRLAGGGVIVSAAKQGNGRLYVQTKDVTVSVVGTVFFVNAEETGSRVAVMEGEVHVQQGQTVKKLFPGEQVATKPTMKPVPVTEEIAWSRNAATHVALLQQSASAPTGGLANISASARPEFEVASVRVNTSGTTASRLEDKNERVTISNATLTQIIRYAYKDYQSEMSGPGLLDSERYDIVAKAPSGTPDSQLLPMLQTLLADRFKMALRRETTEMPVYALVVGKDGPKLREVASNELVSGGGSGTRPASAAPLASMQSVGTLPAFSAALSRHVDRPVVDKTGLSGRFAIFLSYLPERFQGVDGASGPSIFTALQEQLGLKLDPQKGSVEMIIIDRVERPDPN